jgi:hypothetical protein
VSRWLSGSSSKYSHSRPSTGRPKIVQLIAKIRSRQERLSSAAKAAVLIAAREFTALSAFSAIFMGGVLKSMFVAKLKLMVGVLMIMTALGASGLVYWAAEQPASPAEKHSDGRPKSELEHLRHENELLKLNLQIVLEKMCAQEAELRTLRERIKGYDNELNEAREFIYRVWPTLDILRLEVNMSKAQNAFKKCKDVGDRISIRKLLKGTEGHAERLRKELELLRPEVVLDDEKEAQQLKKVSEKIAKLGEELQQYLKVHADGR